MRLIVNEMILDDLEDALQKNKNNFLNHYVTEGGQTGNQVNGEWSILSQTRKEIASLKKSLNFTMDGQMNLVKAGGGSSPDSKNNNLRSKAKGWYK